MCALGLADNISHVLCSPVSHWGVFFPNVFFHSAAALSLTQLPLPFLTLPASFSATATYILCEVLACIYHASQCTKTTNTSVFKVEVHTI